MKESKKERGAKSESESDSDFKIIAEIKISSRRSRARALDFILRFCIWRNFYAIFANGNRTISFVYITKSRQIYTYNIIHVSFFCCVHKSNVTVKEMCDQNE